MGWRGVRGHTASFRAVSLTRTSSGGRKAVHLDLTVRHRSAARWVAQDSLSTNDDLPWLAVLLVFSNHWPASLLSPELVLLESSCGETLDGGLALSLARFGELCVVVEALAFRLDEAGGLWRRETDWWAGGRRGWDRAAAGMVPGRSFIMAAVQRVGGSTRGGCSPCALGGECECCSSAGRGCRIAKLAEEIVG